MIKKLIPWIVFAVFGFYLMGGLFGAKLGMIDDHEIPLFLGTNGVVTLSEFPGVLASTELGAWGENLRFRPGYYTLRVLETMLWRDNAMLWYMTRYILLVISMWMGWRIMSRYFPKILSYLFVFYILTIPFWQDLLTRLGPSEIYGVPSLLAVLYGYIFGKPWILLAGYLVAVGSKENFLFLVPLLIFWMWQTHRAGKLTKNLWVGSVLSLLFSMWVVGGIVLATSTAGVDTYATSISYRYRVTRFVWDIPKIIKEHEMYLSLSTLIISSLLLLRERKNLLIQNVILSLLCIYAIIASQYVIYTNQIPTLMRYDYPVMILFRVADIVAIYGIIQYTAKYKIGRIIKLGMYTALGIVFILFTTKYQYQHIIAKVPKVVSSSNQFAERISRASEVAKSKPDSALVYVSAKWIDFEPIISVARYLSARGVINNMILSYTPDPSLSDPLGIELEQRYIRSMTGEATSDTSFERFSPTSKLSTPCYSITFGETEPLPACPELVNF